MAWYLTGVTFLAMVLIGFHRVFVRLGSRPPSRSPRPSWARLTRVTSSTYGTRGTDIRQPRRHSMTMGMVLGPAGGSRAAGGG